MPGRRLDVHVLSQLIRTGQASIAVGRNDLSDAADVVDELDQVVQLNPAPSDADGKGGDAEHDEGHGPPWGAP